MGEATMSLIYNLLNFEGEQTSGTYFDVQSFPNGQDPGRALYFGRESEVLQFNFTFNRQLKHFLFQAKTYKGIFRFQMTPICNEDGRIVRFHADFGDNDQTEIIFAWEYENATALWEPLDVMEFRAQFGELECVEC